MLDTQSRSTSVSTKLTKPFQPSDTLVIFDDLVQNVDVLYRALLPGSVGFTIGAQDNALEVITQLLIDTGAQYLSIVAHGEAGGIHLGKNLVNIEQLQVQSQLLQGWKLKEISLYCCEVAKDSIGKHFIYQLSELTGATVAASATSVGNTALGGSWELDVITGKSSAPGFFNATTLQNYPDILLFISLRPSNPLPIVNPVEGAAIGEFYVDLDAPAPAGGIIVNFTTLGSTATPTLDYNLIPGTGITAVTANTFTIAAGATSAILKLVAYTDRIIDPNETVIIKVTDGIGYTSGNFSPPTTIPGITGIPSAFRDFNGDTKPDIATFNGTNVSVSLGNGLGDFIVSPIISPVNGTSFSSDVGDINNDGRLDLITANSNDSSVSVLLGNGLGGFGVPNLRTAPTPKFVKIKDFNSDGNLDFVTTSYNSSYISVFFGDGTGSFGLPTTYSSGTPTGAVAVGDFNNDSYKDLVVTGGDGLLIFLGSINGVFNPFTYVYSGSPTSVTVGDFNSDGNLDLAADNFNVLPFQFPSNFGGSTVSVLLGDGSGGFSAPSYYGVGQRSAGVEAGDLDGDGDLDLVVSKIGRITKASILRGDGNGGFGYRADLTDYVSAQIFDINGDNKLDLVSGTSVRLNGSYPISSTLTIGDVLPIPRRNDFGNDNKSDILWRNTSGEVYTYQIDGYNVASEGSLGIVSNDWTIASTGDFDGDLKADVLWRNNFTGTAYVWKMDGNTKVNEGAIRTVGLEWQIAGTGDFNGDSKSDILWRNNNTGGVYIYQMDSLTGIGSEKLIRTVGLEWQIAGTGDFNGDSKSDILWRNNNTGAAYIYFMNGTTVTNEGLVRNVGLDFKIEGIDDFNGDGKSDILWRNTSNGNTFVYQMNSLTVQAEGSIGEPFTTSDYKQSYWKIAGTGDYSGDSKADILWRNDNGLTYLWKMDGLSVIGEGAIRQVDNSWNISAPTI
jgi:Domain of unknown function (DUF4347)/FG-GAP-like repeat/FG-GAP repeat